MRRILLYFFATLLSTLALFARESEHLAFFSNILNREIHYSVVLPENYDRSSQRYPVMYMLHGLGDNDVSWTEYGSIAQISSLMTKRKEISPMILIAPEGFKDYYSDVASGDYDYQQMFVKELVPLIDSLYRTKPEASQRAVTGYSMGGFGALMLPINHPDVFRTSIPLSASIRTNEQYMTEGSQKGWNQQWGRIFGGTDAVGAARITDRYRANSPFFALADRDTAVLNTISFFIDNGDKEGTLCRSNEELHQLMLDRGIRHIYRVREGGHTFEFWRTALPDVFRFADARFNNRSFRFSVPENRAVTKKDNRKPWVRQIEVKQTSVNVYFPQDPEQNNRKYAVVYITGCGSAATEHQIVQYYLRCYDEGTLPAMVLCFVPQALEPTISDEVIPALETKGIARENLLLRSLWALSGNGDQLLETVPVPQQFTAAVFTNVVFSKSKAEIEKLVKENRKANENLRLYIHTPSIKESTYTGNGFLHVALRENEFIHEYRAMPFVTPSSALFSEAFEFISRRIHH